MYVCLSKDCVYDLAETTILVTAAVGMEIDEGQIVADSPVHDKRLLCYIFKANIHYVTMETYVSSRPQLCQQKPARPIC